MVLWWLPPLIKQDKISRVTSRCGIKPLPVTETKEPLIQTGLWHVTLARETTNIALFADDVWVESIRSLSVSLLH